MTNFQPFTSIEGASVQVNFDNVIHIAANDEHSSLITFTGGETLLIRGELNSEWPGGNKSLIIENVS
jgi:hypothetical protein